MEWSGQRLPKVLPSYSGGRLPGRSTKEKDKEEGEVDDDGEERIIRSQIAQEGGCRHQGEGFSCMVVSRRPYKDQLGKVSCEVGIAHKSKMKKRRKAGDKERPDGSTVG